MALCGGQDCKLRADFIGASPDGLLSKKRPVEKPASRMQSAPQSGIAALNAG
jgi:hypothetical protein